MGGISVLIVLGFLALIVVVLATVGALFMICGVALLVTRLLTAKYNQPKYIYVFSALSFLTGLSFWLPIILPLVMSDFH